MGLGTPASFRQAATATTSARVNITARGRAFANLEQVVVHDVHHVVHHEAHRHDQLCDNKSSGSNSARGTDERKANTLQGLPGYKRIVSGWCGRLCTHFTHSRQFEFWRARKPSLSCTVAKVTRNFGAVCGKQTRRFCPIPRKGPHVPEIIH